MTDAIESTEPVVDVELREEEERRGQELSALAVKILKERPDAAAACNVMIYSRQLFQTAVDSLARILHSTSRSEDLLPLMIASMQQRGSEAFDAEKLFENVQRSCVPFLQRYVQIRQREDQSLAEAAAQERLQARLVSAVPLGFVDIPQASLLVVVGDVKGVQHALQSSLQSIIRKYQPTPEKPGELVMSLQSSLSVNGKSAPAITPDGLLLVAPLGAWVAAASTRKRLRRTLGDLLQAAGAGRAPAEIGAVVIASLLHISVAGNSAASVDWLAATQAAGFLRQWAHDQHTAVIVGWTVDDLADADEAARLLSKTGTSVIRARYSPASQEDPEQVIFTDVEGVEISKLLCKGAYDDADRQEAEQVEGPGDVAGGSGDADDGELPGGEPAPAGS